MMGNLMPSRAHLEWAQLPVGEAMSVIQHYGPEALRIARAILDEGYVGEEAERRAKAVGTLIRVNVREVEAARAEAKMEAGG